jgi:hypothetical protein
MSKTKRTGTFAYSTGPLASVKDRLTKEATRMRKQIVRLNSYGLPPKLKIADRLKTAVDEIFAAIKVFDEVPDNWTPIRGTVGATPMEVGTWVVVKPSFYPKWKDFIDVKRACEITKIVGGKIACRVTGTDGNLTVVVFPRSHVVLAD